MSSDEKQKPPTPVIVAVVLYAVYAAIFIAAGIAFLFAGIVREPRMALFSLLFFVVALLPGSIAQGLWRGYRGSRSLAIVMGVFTLPAGLVIVLLLVWPSSRKWFQPALRRDSERPRRAVPPRRPARDLPSRTDREEEKP